MDYTLQQLRYLVSVADHGSVSGAARSLYVSQPGVSAAISHLEDVFGMQFFVRHHAKGVTLTSAGKRFVAESRDVLTRAHDLQRHARELSDTVRGRLEIGCFSTISPFFLPKILSRFREEYPEIETFVFDGTTEKLQRQLIEGHIEVAMMYDLNLDAKFRKTPLVSLRPYALLPKSHPLAAKNSVALEDLVDEPLVLFDRPQHDDYLLSLFHGQGRQPNISQRIRNFELVRGLVGAGKGYAILNLRPVPDQSYDGSPVAVVRIHSEVEPARIVLATLANSTASRRTEAFLRTCEQVVQRFDALECRWLPEPQTHGTDFSSGELCVPEPSPGKA